MIEKSGPSMACMAEVVPMTLDMLIGLYICSLPVERQKQATLLSSRTATLIRGDSHLKTSYQIFKLCSVPTYT